MPPPSSENIYGGLQTMEEKDSALPTNISASKSGLWNELLAASESSSAAMRDSHVLVLGNPDVGKSSVIRTLQRYGSCSKLDENELFSNTNGMSVIDSGFINARRIDEADDLNTADAEGAVNLWILQSLQYQSLLTKRMKPEFLGKLCILIFLDLQKPWKIIRELEEWLAVASSILSTLMAELTVEAQDAIREKHLKHNSGSRRATYHKHSSLDKAQVEGTDVEASHLYRSIVPIIVVVCKSDAYKALDSRKFPGHIDVVLAYLRKVCYSYDAAIVFTNVKPNEDPKNCLYLYQYLMHRLYGFELSNREPKLDEVESYFMPSGWDTEDDINTFVRKTVAEDFLKPYESIITRPTNPRRTQASSEAKLSVECMDEFLQRMLETHPTAGVDATPRHVKIDAAPTIVPQASGTVPLTKAGSIGSIEGEEYESGLKGTPTTEGGPSDASKDPASLQDFFKGLMTKRGRKTTSSRQKVPRERPSVSGEALADAGTDKGDKRES